MSLELNDVKRIANLAKLDLSEAEAQSTLDKLNGFFTIAEQLNAVDTTGIEPLSHPLAALMPEFCLRLREDQVTESNQRDAYQRVAPTTQDGLYLVPKVIE
ncbi:Asp-tRNA(Asn)/Glu-tRNA(Gln) amidotransferase subunit GatC [Undibacterium fentianense]|uniref:Aspartyl/glutamyl-tRNA(Asn/Gln) amidotransferase subunit C n=1 Tax=Undibacterium fentianense TaxID=2828728 RepID=A0A941E5G2_9BURK|nr:Asp-tRNA(Asn)/Glu-tRNA(Gln) amidotransferase subunit GatC [Undibacterium fentianense]MBR7801502.1 Asp-tRNA(Asn)/Glu-tRNA(Gln) amidotransferase subunit GatC [Undibacterium fentianense]